MIDPIALRSERLARLRSGIIEFAGLPNDDRARANDQDRVDVIPSGHCRSDNPDLLAAPLSGHKKKRYRASLPTHYANKH
jgi:hypothetical protein